MDIPERPDEKLFITVDKSTFVNDDISPASIVSAFADTIDASPNIPTELVICAILDWKLVTSVTSSPKLCFPLLLNSPFLLMSNPVILDDKDVSLLWKLSAYDSASVYPYFL